MSEQADDEQQQPQQPEMSAFEQEKAEEAKLKMKYPGGFGGRPGGHSAFLQKRLAKGQQKFFDSGDYQMAKQKGGGGAGGIMAAGTGGAPINPAKQLLAHQKTAAPSVIPYATGDAIPTPETVPARKTSIIQNAQFHSPSSQTNNL